MTSPLILPFAVNTDMLQTVVDAEPHAQIAARRKAAFAGYLHLGRELTLPYRKLMWVTGERTMHTKPIVTTPQVGLTDDGRPSDELATIALANAGGLVHFGGLSIRRAVAAELPPGVTIVPLTQALRQHGDALEPFLARRIERAKSRDAFLTGAFLNCGAYISIAPGVKLAEPLQLLWIYAAGQAHAVFPFIAITLGAGAEATIFERHLGAGDAFVCGMVDAQVAENASLKYVVLQQMSDGSQLRMNRLSTAEQQATVGMYLADIGAAKVRNATTLRLQGRSATGRTAALSFRGGKQRIDNTLRIDIRAAEVRSASVTTIALTDASVARHHERITLRSRANRADATSICDGLLLSRKAAVEFVPERHAAHDRAALHQRSRIGSVDAATMFYLATRGIDQLSALKTVALGFFEPAILAFPDEIIRDEVRTALDEHIEEAVS